MHLIGGQADTVVFSHGLDHIVDEFLQLRRLNIFGGEILVTWRNTGWPNRVTLRIDMPTI